MNKKHLFFIVALALVVALFLGLYLATRPSASNGIKVFTLIVEHGDGTVKDYECRSDVEFVGEVLFRNGVITGSQGPYGLYIESVDGEQAIYEEDGAYWAFYIGDEYATTGIDQTPIVDGQVYKLVYTKADE